MPLEDARDASAPIRILHAAVDLAGIAPTGPIGEFLSVIDDQKILDKLRAVAMALLARNDAAVPRARATAAAS